MTPPALRPILYHYDLSPFSEKIRAMMGLTQTPWQSVKVPEHPPRPGLATLAGGYRKIPVLQVGADVYCDSNAIAAELARWSGKPALDVVNRGKEEQDFVRHAELQAFLSVLLADPLGGLRMLARERGVVTMVRFLVDRIGVGRKAKMPKMSAGKAKGVLKDFFADVESRLAADFLFGDEPSAADFAAYTVVFFAGNVGHDPLRNAPRMAGWLARMQAFGHGTSSEITDDEALNIARDARPLEIAGEMKIDEQRRASIAPADYARDPTVGTLVGENDRCWILRREQSRVGTVHVHFPKAGYSLRAASAD